MMRRILILTVLAAFVLAGPAMAVKRVPKSDDRPSIETQKPDRATGSSDQKAPSEPPKKQGDDRDTARRKEEPQPERAKAPDNSVQKDRPQERDRFIDENGDGVNDRFKKPPETVKKKKESDDSSQKKPSKERRDR